MKQMTVKMLKAFCEEEIRNGNGDMNIVISDDAEGNGFHGLFYGFTNFEAGEMDDMIYDSLTNSPEDTIILG